MRRRRMSVKATAGCDAGRAQARMAGHARARVAGQARARVADLPVTLNTSHPVKDIIDTTMHRTVEYNNR